MKLLCGDRLAIGTDIGNLRDDTLKQSRKWAEVPIRFHGCFVHVERPVDLDLNNVLSA